jgi:hypothetical protein
MHSWFPYLQSLNVTELLPSNVLMLQAAIARTRTTKKDITMFRILPVVLAVLALTTLAACADTASNPFGSSHASNASTPAPYQAPQAPEWNG